MGFLLSVEMTAARQLYSAPRCTPAASTRKHQQQPAGVYIIIYLFLPVVTLDEARRARTHTVRLVHKIRAFRSRCVLRSLTHSDSCVAFHAFSTARR